MYWFWCVWLCSNNCLQHNEIVVWVVAICKAQLQALRWFGEEKRAIEEANKQIDVLKADAEKYIETAANVTNEIANDEGGYARMLVHTPSARADV